MWYRPATVCATWETSAGLKYSQTQFHLLLAYAITVFTGSPTRRYIYAPSTPYSSRVLYASCMRYMQSFSSSTFSQYSKESVDGLPNILVSLSIQSYPPEKRSSGICRVRYLSVLLELGIRSIVLWNSSPDSLMISWTPRHVTKM